MLLNIHVVDTQPGYEFICKLISQTYTHWYSHIIIISDTGANDITDQFLQTTSIVFLSLTQPRAFGDDKVGFAYIICLHTVL